MRRRIHGNNLRAKRGLFFCYILYGVENTWCLQYIEKRVDEKQNFKNDIDKQARMGDRAKRGSAEKGAKRV